MTQADKLYCRGCGATLPIKANIGRVKCEFCGTINFIETDQKVDGSHSSCPNCGFVNLQSAQYCGHCGKPLYHTCPRCGAKNRSEITFCTECGADIEKGTLADKTHYIQNTDEIYADYLREVQRLFREYQRAYLPFSVLGILMIFGAVYLFVSGHVSFTVLYLLLFLIVIISIVATTASQKKVKNAAKIIAQSKPGFDEFQKSFFRNKGWFGWPQTLNGRWRKKFLSIIGKA